MAKGYKTANGKLVDMDGLRLKNESTIAVGNMHVNARGDVLGPGGKVVKTRNERMNENYRLHSMIPKNEPVHDNLTSALAAEKIKEDEKRQKVEQKIEKPKQPPKPREPKVETIRKTSGLNLGTIQVKDDTVESEPVVVSSEKKPRGSLAATVAAPEENTTSIPPRKKVRRIGRGE